MPKFDSSYGPEPVEFDFSDLPGYGPNDAGVIPEPTAKLIRDYAWAMDEVEALGFPQSEHPSAWVSQRRKLADEQRQDGGAVDRDKIEAALEENSDRIAQAVAAVCQDSPNADQIRKLPATLLATFILYVNENFIFPEYRGAGSKLSTRAGAGSGSTSDNTSDTA